MKLLHKSGPSLQPGKLPIWLICFVVFSTCLQAKVLFQENFSKSPDGSFPVSLSYMGKLTQSNSPLLNAFSDFHVETDVAFVQKLAKAVHAEAEKQNLKSPFTISGNLSSALSQDPRWLEIALALDYLNKEMHFEKNAPYDYHLIGFYKAAEAIGSQSMMMPDASNNAAWSAQEDPKFYAFITAQAYAYGQMIHAPYNLYDGTAMGRFYGKFENYNDVFSFVRKNQKLFDDYTSAASTVLIVPYEPERYNWTKDAQLEQAVSSLTTANVPFKIIFIGPGMPAPDYSELARVDEIRVFGDLPKYQPEAWKSIERFGRRSPAAAPFTFEGSSAVRVLPRGSSSASTMPLVFHLLAQPTLRANEMTLRVNRTMLPGVDLKAATLHVPGKKPVSVNVRANKESWVISVPSFDYWGVLTLETSVATASPYTMAPPRKPIIARSEVPIMRLYHGNNPESTYPQWLASALKSGADPIASYDATRLSWSYRKSSSYIKEITGRGLAFIGAINLGAEIPGGNITLDWQGFARAADGEPLKFRTDFANVPYLGGMASNEYFQNAVDRNVEWMKLGATGIQWDDLDAYVLRVYNKAGGDFSEPAMQAFSKQLKERYSSTQLASMGLKDLDSQSIKKAIERARAAGIPLKVSKAGGKDFLVFPYMPSDHSGELRGAGTPALDSDSNIVYADFDVRMNKGDGNTSLGLYLYDGDRTVFASSTFISGSTLKVYTEGKMQNVGKNLKGIGTWNRVTIRFNFGSQETSYSINGGDWSRPYPFRNKGAAKRESFSVVVLNRPDDNTVECEKIEVRSSN